MTYQDFGRIVKTVVSAPFYLLGAIGRGIEGVRLYEALHRLSDRELAALGIERDGIARHVAESMDPQTLRRPGRMADVHAFAATEATTTPAAEQHRAAA